MDQRFGVFLQLRVNRGGATSWSLLGSQKTNRIRNRLVPWMLKQADWLPDASAWACSSIQCSISIRSSTWFRRFRAASGLRSGRSLSGDWGRPASSAASAK